MKRWRHGHRMDGKTDHQSIPDALLPRLSECLTAKLGFLFQKKRWHELHTKMAAAMKDFGFDDVGEFVEWLIASSPTQKQIEILASHLTVGETYFFREKKAFEILEQSILPGLIDARRGAGKRLRFWSAGCSTGEEPYSLAMLLDRLIPDLKDWNVTILATDINAMALRKAGEGVYSEWSFRDTPSLIKTRYFEKVNGNHYSINPDIRKTVTFSYVNLSDDAYPALQNNTNAMDVILCRNVLIYFASDQAKRTTERFYHALVDGGWLIVSPVETSHVHYAPFGAVRIQDSTFYKKDVQQKKPDSIAAKYIEQPITPYMVLPKRLKPRQSVQLPHPRTHHAQGKPQPSALTPLEEAAILYGKGFYIEAEAKLGEMISRGESTPDMMVLIAKILANQGKLEDACRWCEKALSGEKMNPRLYYLHAIILDEQKKGEEARASLKKALYLDHDFVLAHFSLANLSIRLGNLSEARKHFRNATAILSRCKPDEILPDSEGITAGRLAEMISAVHMQES